MRKAIAMLGVLIFLVLYAIAASTIGSWLSGANGFVQLLFYVIAGVVWVFPLKPLMDWMNRPSGG